MNERKADDTTGTESTPTDCSPTADRRLRICERRGRVNLNEKSVPDPTDFNTAVDIVTRSGLDAALQALLDRRVVGRPRTLRNVRAYLVASVLNALQRHHRGHITEIVRVLYALDAAQRNALGLTCWDVRHGLDWVYRLVDWLVAVLEEGPEVELNGRLVRLDATVFMNALITASLPTGGLPIRSVAIDGTAIDPWAVLEFDAEEIELKVEGDDDLQEAEPKRGRSGKERALTPRAYTPTGRPIYTKDWDALGGYRTRTNSRKGGRYVGFELHLAVATRTVTSTNGRDRITLSDEVPELIVGASLASAGTHKGVAALPIVHHLRATLPEVGEIVVDAGYSLLVQRFMRPVRRLGYDVTFEAVKHQRGLKPYLGDAVLVDGTFFSVHAPDNLTGVGKSRKKVLPMPKWRGDEEAKRPYEEPFNQRAKFAFTRHSKPDADGYIRIRCPFCAGRAKSNTFPASKRNPNSAAYVDVAGEPRRCCKTRSGVITVKEADAALWQRIPFGTTAWRISYSRRQAVESANAALKGQFVNMDRSYARIFGLTKRTIITAFSLVGYNVDRLGAFEARVEQQRLASLERPKHRAA